MLTPETTSQKSRTRRELPKGLRLFKGETLWVIMGHYVTIWGLTFVTKREYNKAVCPQAHSSLPLQYLPASFPVLIVLSDACAIRAECVPMLQADIPQQNSRIIYRKELTGMPQAAMLKQASKQASKQNITASSRYNCALFEYDYYQPSGGSVSFA